jgi:hypothetical protein
MINFSLKRRHGFAVLGPPTDCINVRQKPNSKHADKSFIQSVQQSCSSDAMPRIHRRSQKFIASIRTVGASHCLSKEVSSYLHWKVQAIKLHPGDWILTPCIQDTTQGCLAYQRERSLWFELFTDVKARMGRLACTTFHTRTNHFHRFGFIGLSFQSFSDDTWQVWNGVPQLHLWRETPTYCRSGVALEAAVPNHLVVQMRYPLHQWLQIGHAKLTAISETSLSTETSTVVSSGRFAEGQMGKASFRSW